jgi:acyl dehydratase
MVDRSAIGLSFDPVTAHVEPGRLRYFFNTLGETQPIYRDPAAAEGAGYKGTPIPPTYLFCLEMMDNERPFAILQALDIDLKRVLHGEQRFNYFHPIVVGDTLTFHTGVTDVVEKKGGALTLIALETKVVNHDGLHVANVGRVVVVRN